MSEGQGPSTAEMGLGNLTAEQKQLIASVIEKAPVGSPDAPLYPENAPAALQGTVLSAVEKRIVQMATNRSIDVATVLGALPNSDQMVAISKEIEDKGLISEDGGYNVHRALVDKFIHAIALNLDQK